MSSNVALSEDNKAALQFVDEPPAIPAIVMPKLREIKIYTFLYFQQCSLLWDTYQVSLEPLLKQADMCEMCAEFFFFFYTQY